MIDEAGERVQSASVREGSSKIVLSVGRLPKTFDAYAESLGSAKLPDSGRQEYLESIVNSIMFK